MNIADIGLLVLVYIYVIAIFVFSEKFLKDLPSFSRRFVHIMVGNCIFVMPFFNDPYAMVWFLTLPITIAAFLLTKYSPIKIKSGVTDAGHALGLVYYAGIWTLLIFLLPASILFSTSSFTTLAILSTTSPAAILFAKFSLITFILFI